MSDTITPDSVRHALRAIRRGGHLRHSPLLSLESLAIAHRSTGFSDNPEARAATLGKWLEEIVWERLCESRGEGGRAGHEKPTYALREDFRHHSQERQAWGVVHLYYFSDPGVTMRDIAGSCHVGYNTVRRRLVRGIASLAEELQQLERTALATLPRATRVPHQLSSFIGRETELGAIRSLMTSHRLVTLTGPGGIGKSRLAVRLAETLESSYPDGTWFADMTGVRDDHEVAEFILAAVGHRGMPGRPAVETLTNYLADRHAMLVIDNCEHVTKACSKVTEHLLGQCRALQILATSRERLRVAGGVDWSVPALALPSNPTSASAFDLSQYDATRLFQTRAAKAEPRFQIRDENAGEVATICTHLEGIPLAIELAAARLRHLTLSQLGDRVEDRFTLLRGGRESLRPSHETLRATLDVSYELLTQEERLMLQRLSVFRGGWSLESAEAVCSGDGIERDFIIDLLEGLHAKSLLHVRPGTRQRRYRMLSTIRQYAADKLSSEGAPLTWQARLSQHFTSLAEQAAFLVFEPHRLEATGILEDLDNYRAVMRHESEQGNPAAAARIAATLVPFWYERGRISEGLRWLDSLLEQDSATWPVQTTADALLAAGKLSRTLGDFGRARERLEESRRLYGELSQVGVATTDVQLGFLDLEQVRGDDAERRFRDALTVFETQGDAIGAAAARSGIAQLCALRGDLDTSADLYLRARELYESAGYAAGVATTHTNRGQVFMRQSRIREAQIELEAALEYHRRLGDSFALGIGLQTLAMVVAKGGDHDTSHELFRESVQITRELGDQPGICYAYLGLAAADFSRARYATAERHYLDGLHIAKEHGYESPAFVGLAGLVALLIRQGRLAEATKRLAELTDIAETMGFDHGTVLDRQGLLRMAQNRLGEARSALIEAIDRAAAAGDRASVARSVEHLAEVEERAGCAARALILASKAAALRQRQAVAIPPEKQSWLSAALRSAREAVGAEEAKRAEARGGALSDDDFLTWLHAEMTT